ncbi:MAG: ThiF family adenylyltransferase [Ekhidna sp.]|uniref:ThiF family adenylyltransferase n=1 Tax=Reichenbachiella sp. TaxID=2184521 RepID=UPI003263D31C
MTRELLLRYIEDTEGIEFVKELVDSKLFKNEQPLFLFGCQLTVDNKKVSISLIISKWFPQHLPLFLLPEYDHLGFLPHIEPKGLICYLEKESVFVNREEPKVVFQASVGLAIQTLVDGISGKNKGDFREEFHVFWERNKYILPLHIMSFIEVDDEPKKVLILKNQKKAIVFDSDKNIESQKRVHFRNSATLSKSGIYIPLKLDSDLIPPKYDQNWTMAEFIDWLRPKISDEHWKNITESILDKKPTRFEYLLLGIPRETGPTILVGVHLKPKKETPHPLLKKGAGWGLELLTISRLDNTAFLPRGGSRLELQNKSVLLVGCGSVGSHIALNLAKMGIGKLDLVDKDILKLENIQRFAIGFEYSLKPKVMALREYLDKNHLNTLVAAHENTIESFLDTEGADLTSHDLIISATGDPAINMYLNQECRKKEVPLIVAWNEPYSIGGHAQLSISPQKGCYKCLDRDHYNIASFAAKDQSKPFYKKHLGCGEVYTPYNALDSSCTSEIASRMAVSFLSGQIEQPQVLSWKGNSSEFTSSGFLLSSRYLNQTLDQLEELKNEFVNPECTHCG